MSKGVRSEAQVRAMIASRRRSAMAGKHMGPVPFGFALGEDGKLVVNHDEAVVVKCIFTWIVCGQSFHSIANKLAETHKSMREWSGLGVKFIASNPVYIGMLRFRGRTYRGGHEAIIAPATFKGVQTILRRKASRAKRRRRG